jgi:uncharacterized membrane protein YedE/YeeE
MIDCAAFTPASALSGGLLIGAAASVFVLLDGRVAGISGILGGLLRTPGAGSAWRWAFIAGLLLAPLLYRSAVDLPEARVHASVPMLVAAGLLVGIGTRYGAGCTSGHGVCGVSRLSPRSIVATLLFMASGFATVYLLRHVAG